MSYDGLAVIDRDPDTADILKIAQGDAAAAASLVHRRAPKILRLARRMLNDPIEAEDVTQEVFLRVWKQAASWTPGEALFETWLHRVAINLCLDRLRRRREVTMGDDLPEIHDPGQNSEGLHFDAQRALRVRRAMSALPERQRIAIELCNLQEMSNIDAAAVMEIGVEALESLLSRGRRALREALKEEVSIWLRN